MKSKTLIGKPYIFDLLFVLSVSVFILLKIDHLSLPHYWDEAWSYSTAVNAMYEVGPKILPGHVDPVFTRGHPLLFYFLSSGWMTLFGPSLLSKHLFALALSLGMLWSVYLIGKSLFKSSFWGLSVALLWMVQSMFFVQSSMLLPEILVAWLALLSIFFWSKEKWILLAISLSLLLLTKESGFMFLGGIGIAGLLIAIKNSSILYFKNLVLSLAFPILIIASFFAYQYAIYGWVFFPEHIGMIKLTLGYFGGNLASILALNDHFVLLLIIGLLGIFNYLKNKNVPYLICSLLPVLLAIFSKAQNPIGSSFNTILLIMFIAIFIYYGYAFLMSKGQLTSLHKMLLGSGISMGLYLAFCAMNFFTIRYLMPQAVFISFVVTFQCYYLYKNYGSKIWMSTFTLIPIIYSLIFTIDKSGYGDTNIGAFKAVQLQRETIDFMKANVPTEAKIGWGSFQMSINITNPACGFLDNETQIYKHVDWTVDQQTDFVLFDNIEPDPREQQLLQEGKITVIHEAKYKELISRVYKVNK